MKWFKHYSNASESNALTELIAKTGLAGYGRYWKLLELMANKFSGNETEFVFETKMLRHILGFYHTNALAMYLQCIANVGVMCFECDKDVVRISTPILLELQSRDFKKARNERATSAPKKENKKENKNNSSNGRVAFSHPTTLDEFKLLFPKQTYQGWLELYDNDRNFLARELNKAYQYFYVNKIKKPSASIRGWTRRMNSWLDRAWEKNAKTGAPKSSSPPTGGLRKLRPLPGQGGDA